MSPVTGTHCSAVVKLIASSRVLVISIDPDDGRLPESNALQRDRAAGGAAGSELPPGGVGVEGRVGEEVLGLQSAGAEAESQGGARGDGDETG